MRYLSLFAASLLPALVLADHASAQAAQAPSRPGASPAAVAPPAQPGMGGGFGGGGVGGAGGLGGGGAGVASGGYGAVAGSGSRIAPAAYQVEVMRSWMDTVDRFVRLSQDPVASGVAGVITTVDLLRPQGPEVTIEYLNRLMRETQNATVRRAIRLELVEMYKATNQRDKALDVLHELIVTVPGDGGFESRSFVPPSTPSRAPRASGSQLRIPPPPVPDEAGR